MKRVLLTAVILSALLGCELREQEVGAPKATGNAKTLGMFSTELPDDPIDQALLALEQDAFRRENRFIDAAHPGHLFDATRLEQGEVDAGLWPNESLFQLGAQLFNLTFAQEVGYGAKDLPTASRFHLGRRGGPDARSCVNCHFRGGPAGAGDGADNAYLDGDGESQSSALARNPPSLAGAGLIELLAAEMTAELQDQRQTLLDNAKSSGSTVEAPLSAKGVSFGVLSARADGLLDVSKTEGLDADLVVRPFGWKGSFATLRDAIEDALLVHHGMESSYLVRTAGAERIGPFGGDDPDGDGVVDEVSEGQVSALTMFVAMQEVPAIVLSSSQTVLAAWPKGQKMFEDMGCATCHVPSMVLDSPLFVLPSRVGGAPTVVDLTTESAKPRAAVSTSHGTIEVFLFSDLKRHDIGPEMAESRWDRGVRAEQFLTRPLWGLARSRPYMHDARAPTIEDAIYLHGGEAQESRDAFFALSEADRAPLRVYLTSLTRARRMVAP